MLTNVAFAVPGPVQGKGRARIVKIGGFSRMATPSKTVAYEGLIAMYAAQAMAGAAPFDVAMSIEVRVTVAVPASWSRRKREAALAGTLIPTSKPDMDNVLKSVGDGCNGVLWVDDRLISAVSMSRAFGVSPGLWVNVATMGAA